MGVVNQIYTEDSFCMEVVDKSTTSIFADFTCGNSFIDKYFHEKAKNDTNICYAYRELHLNKIIGLASICCSGINLNDAHLTSLLPAFKIDYFAIATSFQNILYSPMSDETDHFYLSDLFLSKMVSEIRQLSQNAVGASYIILYSVQDARHFYKRNLFKEFQPFMKPENNRIIDDCIPMFLEL